MRALFSAKANFLKIYAATDAIECFAFIGFLSVQQTGMRYVILFSTVLILSNIIFDVF